MVVTGDGFGGISEEQEGGGGDPSASVMGLSGQDWSGSLIVICNVMTGPEKTVGRRVMAAINGYLLSLPADHHTSPPHQINTNTKSKTKYKDEGKRQRQEWWQPSTATYFSCLLPLLTTICSSPPPPLPASTIHGVHKRLIASSRLQSWTMLSGETGKNLPLQIYPLGGTW